MNELTTASKAGDKVTFTKYLRTGRRTYVGVIERMTPYADNSVEALVACDGERVIAMVKYPSGDRC